MESNNLWATIIAFLIVIKSFSQINSYEKALLNNYVNDGTLIIVNNSIKVNYYNNNFSDYYPPYYQSGNILAARQAKFDYYYNLVNSAYSKVYYQELINKKNKVELQNWKNQINNYVKRKLNNIDWSVQANFATKVREYFFNIYKRENIKKELILLQNINKELNRLKREFPGSFHKTDRYYELLSAIGTLKNCNPSEIGNISFKYGLF